MSILQHFRPEERPFVEKMVEWIETVERRGVPRLTDFLDPRKAHIVQSLVNRATGIRVRFFGGYPEAERVRAFVAPEYIPAEDEDFQLALLSIVNRSPFHRLEHRDYLGALLGLGIIREKFGDLLIHPWGAQLILVREMTEFVRTHLQQVGRAPVAAKEVPFSGLQVPERHVSVRTVTVPALRLDAVLADALHLSRSKVLPLIEAGKVKVNWMVAEKPSFALHAGDVVSVRGFGRFQVLELAGTSKKGNLIVRIGLEKERGR